MEVVLEGAEGVPEGGILSLKFGDTKRQAPVSKCGQPFRFATSPLEPLPLKAELLLPVAPPKTVTIDPTAERFVIDFGGDMKVTLLQRAARDLERPAVDIQSAVESRGLASEKLQLAQKAAAYLEEHDLVRMFQDILHGLLLAKPDDPLAYVEARLARAKLVAAKQRGSSPTPPAEGTPTTPAKAKQGSRPTVRGSTFINKVDTLLMTLQYAHDNLQLVVPFLPADLQEVLESRELGEECLRHFEALDAQGKGELTPHDLQPVIVQLSQSGKSSVTEDQCRRFVAMFDANQDGVISAAEFTDLVRFVIVAGFLESDEGRDAIDRAMVQENAFQEFITMIESDKERLWSLIPFLPEWLVSHVTSQEFQDACHQNFDDLDRDRSGTLEPLELIPIVESLSEGRSLTIDAEKCRQFATIFTRDANACIRRDEFTDFAQFLTVMNFLSNTSEGKLIKQRAELESNSARTARFIEMLEQDPSAISKVLPSLPGALVRELTSDNFVRACRNGWAAEIDVPNQPRVQPAPLLPVVVQLCEAYQFPVTLTECQRCVELFNRSAMVSLSEFTDLARYIVVLEYLRYSKENQDKVVGEVLLGDERITELLNVLTESIDQLRDLVPFLPKALVAELSSPTFDERCETDFRALDKDNSGVLEPAELLPVIYQLTEVHRLALTEEHCRRFVAIFDSERKGVIGKGDFSKFARFMVIMAFLETEEGQLVAHEVEVRRGHDAVEELLRTLERDRHAVHKVVPLLPDAVYRELTSDSFVVACQEGFQQLDQDGKGFLRPADLIPVVVQLSAAQPCAVTEDQCQRFTAIFDVHGDGVLRPAEFLDFSRFLCIMSYLDTEEGKAAAQEVLTVLEDTKRIEDLIKTMEQDRSKITSVMPYLPSWLRQELLGHNFTVECLQFFKELDKDSNGSLDPEELFPVVLSLANAHQLSLDREQCKRFTAVFDEERKGVISSNDFVNFARFLIVMSFLHSQEGKEVLQLAEEKVDVAPPRDPPNAPAKTPTTAACAAADSDFYKGRAEKLSQENDTLRERMFALEQSLRQMASKVEEQEHRLLKTEMGLRQCPAV